MITFRPSPEMEEDLNKLSQETHRSKSYYLREALREYLENLKEVRAAVSSYENHMKRGGKGVSWEEVQKKAGLLEDE